MTACREIQPTDPLIYATRLYLEALWRLGVPENVAFARASRIVLSTADDKTVVAALMKDLDVQTRKATANA